MAAVADSPYLRVRQVDDRPAATRGATLTPVGGHPAAGQLAVILQDQKQEILTVVNPDAEARPAAHTIC